MNKQWRKTKVKSGSDLRKVLSSVEQIKAELVTHEQELVTELKDLQARLKENYPNG